MVKYVLISGGVISGIGKGVIASSIGLLLRSLGFHVTAIKIDPYLNIDAGTMSPFEHGEVFILDDGGEVDLDLGNYERFMDVLLSRNNNITTGKIYSKVIEKEREGKYLGKTVQVVPHICDAIQEWIEQVASVPTVDGITLPDICIVELGGTIGDIESMPFVEALRQFQFRVGKENFVDLHVSLVPVVGNGEQKTKPTQSSVRQLRSMGLSPDMIVCRSNDALEAGVSKKIAQFCHVNEQNVIAVHNVSNIYHVPLLLDQQMICQKILNLFHIECPPMTNYLDSWRAMAFKMDEIWRSGVEDTIRIAMIGKYTGMYDSYLSIIKSITHSSIHAGCKTEIVWIESVDLELSMKAANPTQYDIAWEKMRSVDGIIVPGGFGDRGVEGMIISCQYAREHNIPFFGICLGFQSAVIEVARSKLQFESATSEEFNPHAEHKVIIFMPEGSRTHMGGTMRLGKRSATFVDDNSKLFKLYGEQRVIEERHRHRYEVNPTYIAQLESVGLKFVARDGERMEIFELEGHPYFVGLQAHPEMKSRPQRPSPPFVGLVAAAKAFHYKTSV